MLQTLRNKAMIKFKKTAILCVSALMFSGAIAAGDFDKEIDGRQSYMGVLGYNMGILGAMAGEKMPYDADLASAAARNLALAAAMNNGSMWPQGSDMDSTEGTWAKADLWQNFPIVMDQLGNLKTYSEALATNAGNGLPSLQAGMKGVGDSCKECHKRFRAKKN
jgi:cytochrome c556